MAEGVFVVLVFLCIGLVAFDFSFSRGVRRPRWLTWVLGLVFVAALLTAPSACAPRPDAPDGPDIPYSF